MENRTGDRKGRTEGTIGKIYFCSARYNRAQTNERDTAVFQVLVVFLPIIYHSKDAIIPAAITVICARTLVGERI